MKGTPPRGQVVSFSAKRARRLERRLRLVDNKLAEAPKVNAEVRELLLGGKPARELVKEVHMFEPIEAEGERARERAPFWLQCVGAALAGAAAAVLLVVVFQ